MTILSPAAPNIAGERRPHGVLGLVAVRAMVTPLPAAAPSALTTTG